MPGNKHGEDTALVKTVLRQHAAEVEAFLAACLQNRDIPEALLRAMQYSLDAGGKRLRPVLCLTCAELFGLDSKNVMPFACAIECIHTYSLIHDDLPAMDDDDLRRGKPSNHKMFGEATAILAGDGLLTESFVLMSETAAAVPAGRVLAATGMIARKAGSAGMVGGQALDMSYTGRHDVDIDALRNMHARKTGALILGSCLSGAMLAGASPEDLERIEAYGKAIGVAFQIVDDILDEVGDEQTLGKPVGSDREQGKVTYPSLLGLEKSRELADACVAEALRMLHPYEGKAAAFLGSLAKYIVQRAQ